MSGLFSGFRFAKVTQWCCSVILLGLVCGGWTARLAAQPNVPPRPKPAPVPAPIAPNAPAKLEPITPGQTAPQPIIKAGETAPVAPVTVPSPFAPATPIDPETLNQKAATNRFVIALAQDKNGAIWIGTEDEGVWRYDEKVPEGKRWRQFTTKDGIGDDNAYAVACDHQGRIWIGHLNHGVSVYNGQSWKNYDVLDGPLGERIFDIAVAPNDGAVWIATNAGLTRYSPQKDDWTYYTRADGLPSDQIAALAFNAKGDLFAGTQCDGLAIARAGDGYKTWQIVRGPERMPNTPLGQGLPSNLINDVLVSRSGAIYVATTCGLARSFDDGASWDYIRGADWEAKVKGLYKGPEPKKIHFSGDFLLEDYSTCLAEDEKGQIWVGHWRHGYEVRDAKSHKRVTAKSSSDFVTALLPLKAQMTFGFYGGGVLSSRGESLDKEFQLPSFIPSVVFLLSKITLSPATTPKSISIAPSKSNEPQAISPTNINSPQVIAPKQEANKASIVWLPTPVEAPSAAALSAMLNRVKSLNEPMKIGEGAYLGEDWRTQGDWFGRYGRQYAVLCAGHGGLDHLVISDLSYKVDGQIGPHHSAGDGLRGWVHWIKTENPKVLYSPVIGYRRQSDWDDHGEEYPHHHEGPDIWVSIRVPEGIHRLSAYFFNKDGHEGANRQRDYIVELKPFTPKIEEADLQPALAQARVQNFWGPLYKQFLVRGPARYYMKVAKNNSFNTQFQGVFLDKVAGPIMPDDRKPLAWTGNLGYAPPIPPSTTATRDSTSLSVARQLWDALDNAYAYNENQNLQGNYRLLSYRAAVVSDGSPKLLTFWRWKIPLWKVEDRQEFAEAMRQTWQAHLKSNPHLRNIQM
jgi:sugar lactone lactonase YvrE